MPTLCTISFAELEALTFEPVLSGIEFCDTFVYTSILLDTIPMYAGIWNLRLSSEDGGQTWLIPLSDSVSSEKVVVFGTPVNISSDKSSLGKIYYSTPHNEKIKTSFGGVPISIYRINNEHKIAVINSFDLYDEEIVSFWKGRKIKTYRIGSEYYLMDI